MGISSKEPLVPLLHAPLTQRPCTAYYLSAHLYDQEWRLAFEESECVDFMLVAEEPSARILGAQAQVALARQVKESTEFADFDAARLVAQRQLQHQQGSSWYFRETVMLPGDRVVVGGVGEREVAPGAIESSDYRGQAKNRPVIQSGDAFPLVISNNSVIFQTSSHRIVVPR